MIVCWFITLWLDILFHQLKNSNPDFRKWNQQMNLSPLPAESCSLMEIACNVLEPWLSSDPWQSLQRCRGQASQPQARPTPEPPLNCSKVSARGLGTHFLMGKLCREGPSRYMEILPEYVWETE